MQSSISSPAFHARPGCVNGMAMGLIQFPFMAAVIQYFDRRRAAALGVVISGSSIGGVVMPLALSKMLNSTNLGFGWSITQYDHRCYGIGAWYATEKITYVVNVRGGTADLGSPKLGRIPCGKIGRTYVICSNNSGIIQIDFLGYSWI